MGCASSKVLGSEVAAEKGYKGFSKGISMPTHPQLELPDDFHIVALTSSTYGILKVDPPKLPEEDTKDGMGAHSVKEVLNKLNNLESKAEAAPQSWLEVSSMLENIKPDLEKPTNPKSGKETMKPQQPDSIDINDIMLDLDEDTGLVRPKARKLANLKKSGKSLPIRTLEELDKRFGGRVNNGDTPAVSIADLRASLKPVGTARASTPSNDMAANGSMPQNNQQHKSSSVMDTGDRVIKDSKLVDDNFLGSYKNAVNTFSEDNWKVVEALFQDTDSDSPRESEDGKHFTGTHVNVERTEEDVAKSSSAISEDMFVVTEGEEETSSSSTEENLMENSLFVTYNGSPTKGGAATKKSSPLEDYEELCPPGGKQAVVLYTTSLRGIRKTYEDCMKTRETVKSYGVLIDERDVSMHLEYRNELRELMQRVVTVPRLFVKGRYIGGAEVVAKLAEEGLLSSLFEGLTRAGNGGKEGGEACDGCGGAKFVPCFECSGSRKVANRERQVRRCSDCNENGLIQCPICS